MKVAAYQSPGPFHDSSDRPRRSWQEHDRCASGGASRRPFLDLDRHLVGRVGDISEYIGRHGYDAYARENVEAYCLVCREASVLELLRYLPAS